MVQEIPIKQKTTEKKKRRGSSLLKYGPAAAILLVTSFILSLSNLIPLILITLPAGIFFSCSLIRAFFENRNREVKSAFMRAFVTPTSTVLSFFVAIALVGLAYTSPLLFDPLLYGYILSLPAVSIAFSALFLNSFGNWYLRNRETDGWKGLVVKRIAGALGLAFLFALASVASIPFVFFGPPFLFAAVAYGITALGPILAYSVKFERFHESGMYLITSAGQWTTIAFLIGIADAIISLPTSTLYTYLAVLILAMFGMAYIGLKMYNMGAERLNKMQQEVYQKHVHQLQIVGSPDFRFLGSATDSFIAEGQKGTILIALTTLLANAGVEFNESSILLSNIANYEIPPIYRVPGLSLKKGLDLEIQRRINIVNSTMSQIAQRVSTRKAFV